MIKITIKTHELQGRLGRLARSLKDRRAPNKALAASLFRMVIDNFDDEAFDGKPWAPLNPAYERYKERIGKERILVITGHMRQSFVPFSNNDQAGVGSLSVREHADLSEVHQFGLNGIPARPMLPGKLRALQEGIVIYNHFIERSRAQAGV